ncbi:MAG: DUF5995 family protein, partial [Polyangiaceae bacterium]
EIMARYRHDHDAVNRILDEAFPEVMELLSERYGCRVARLVVSAGRLPSRAARGVTMRALRAWRARVWLELEELLAAASDAEAGRVRARMDLRASLFARLFSVPL